MKYPSIFEIGKAVKDIDMSFVNQQYRMFRGKVLSGFTPDGSPILDGIAYNEKWPSYMVADLLKMLGMHPNVVIEVCHEYVHKDFYPTMRPVDVVEMMVHGNDISAIQDMCDEPEGSDEVFDFHDSCMVSPLSLYINGCHVWTAPMVIEEAEEAARAKAAADAFFAALPDRAATAAIGVERFAEGLDIVSGKQADVLLSKISDNCIVEAAKGTGRCFIADDEEDAIDQLSNRFYPDGSKGASIYKEEAIQVFEDLVQKNGYDFVYNVLKEHHYMTV